jgi:hypothetical protein
MKTIIAIMAMVLLCSCARTDGWEIYRANEICNEHKGIDYMQHLLGATLGRCGDGKMFRLDN